MKSSPSIWHYAVSVKLMVKILSIFVAFLENTNFTCKMFTYRAQDTTDTNPNIQKISRIEQNR